MCVSIVMSEEFSKGYELIEGPHFEQSVRQKLGDFTRWDEVRCGWEMVLRRDPKAVSIKRSDGILLLSINIPTNAFPLYLQYEIDDKAMCVTYLELI